MDYRREQLVCKSLKGDTVPITASVVVGKAVELSWRLSYRPAVGSLPIPVDLQTPKDMVSVNFSNVLKGGVGRPRSNESVKIYPQDAQKAIDISKRVLGKLLEGPYHLQVHTTDHTGPSQKEAHDLLMSPRIGSGSKLCLGLYSVECVCREVVSPRAFDWAGVLSEEAVHLWKSESLHSPKLWQGRLLVFVQMTQPCHQGDFSLHGLLLRKGVSSWERLFGWAGFSLKSVVVVEAAPLPPSASSSSSSSARTAASGAASAQMTDEQKWKHLRSKLSSDGYDGWYALSGFLEGVGESKRHSSRFVDSTSKQTWILDAGRKPRVRKDWVKKPSKRGAGHGGVIFCKTEFLREVFLRHYVKKYKS